MDTVDLIISAGELMTVLGIVASGYIAAAWWQDVGAAIVVFFRVAIALALAFGLLTTRLDPGVLAGIAALAFAVALLVFMGTRFAARSLAPRGDHAQFTPIAATFALPCGALWWLTDSAGLASATFVGIAIAATLFRFRRRAGLVLLCSPWTYAFAAGALWHILDMPADLALARFDTVGRILTPVTAILEPLSKVLQLFALGVAVFASAHTSSRKTSAHIGGRERSGA